ncbi:MAG: GIY-YIG nuclease family protein [Candidatus Sulfotelmatobacter sp.]
MTSAAALLPRQSVSSYRMACERRYYVYIMASKSRVLYVGVTGFLMARVLRHRAGEGGAFTRKYRVHRLVYYHSFQNVGDAIARETEIKKWRREKKVALIHADNPTWEDLAAGWGHAAVMRVTRTSVPHRALSPGWPT